MFCKHPVTVGLEVKGKGEREERYIRRLHSSIAREWDSRYLRRLRSISSNPNQQVRYPFVRPLDPSLIIHITA